MVITSTAWFQIHSVSPQGPKHAWVSRAGRRDLKVHPALPRNQALTGPSRTGGS